MHKYLALWDVTDYLVKRRGKIHQNILTSGVIFAMMLVDEIKIQLCGRVNHEQKRQGDFGQG